MIKNTNIGVNNPEYIYSEDQLFWDLKDKQQF